MEKEDYEIKYARECFCWAADVTAVAAAARARPVLRCCDARLLLLLLHFARLIYSHHVYDNKTRQRSMRSSGLDSSVFLRCDGMMERIRLMGGTRDA